MSNFKIYTRNNYLIVENDTTGGLYQAFAKDVTIFRDKIDSDTFKLKGIEIGNSVGITGIKFENIVKEDGTPYDDIDAFVEFYTTGTGNFSSGGATPSLPQVLAVGDRLAEGVGMDVIYSFQLIDRTKNVLSDSNATFVLDGDIAFPENSVLMFSCPSGTNTLSFINGTTIYFNGAVLTTDLVMPSFSKGYLTCTDAPAKTWILNYKAGSVERKYRVLLNQENTFISSGTLEVGKRYIIQTYNAGDDFTNVGGSNYTGADFVATGTTPTDWTNGSVLIDVALSLPTEFQRRENTMGFEPDWQYTPYGIYGFPMPGVDLNKVDCFIGSSKNNVTAFFKTQINQDYDFSLYSFLLDGLGNFIQQDGNLFRTELTIIINP